MIGKAWLMRPVYGLAGVLLVDKKEVTRPGAWLDGVYSWVLTVLPWTQAHRFLARMNQAVLFAAPDGHLHICRFGWDWLDDSQPDQGANGRGHFAVITCDNWQALEPEALALLAASGKTLAEGGLLPCPKPLADRARWGTYDAALAAPEGRK